MVPENFIALLAQGNGAEARAVLEDGLSNIVLNRLEERKRELAGGLFSGYATEPVQEEFEQLDEISLKTKTSAYAKAVDRDSPKGDNFAGKIEKNVEKKHGPDGVQKLYNAADRYMYGTRNKKK